MSSLFDRACRKLRHALFANISRKSVRIARTMALKTGKFFPAMEGETNTCEEDLSMSAKLTGRESVPAVLAEMTLDEKI